MFEQARKEVRSKKAKMELNNAEVVNRVYQCLINLIDKDEATIREAAALARKAKRLTLEKRLLEMLNPVTLPYEKIIGICRDITLDDTEE